VSTHRNHSRRNRRRSKSKTKTNERNDRVVAVEKENHSFADIKPILDSGSRFLRELEIFFVNYHELSGEQYRVIDVRGPGQVRERIEAGIRAARRAIKSGFRFR
jgi:inorganic pyrophosphatase